MPCCHNKHQPRERWPIAGGVTSLCTVCRSNPSALHILPSIAAVPATLGCSGSQTSYWLWPEWLSACLQDSAHLSARASRQRAGSRRGADTDDEPPGGQVRSRCAPRPGPQSRQPVTLPTSRISPEASCPPCRVPCKRTKGGSALAFVSLRDNVVEVDPHQNLNILICTQDSWEDCPWPTVGAA